MIVEGIINVIYYTKNDDNILHKKFVDGKRPTIAEAQELMNRLEPEAKPIVIKTLVEDIAIRLTEEELKKHIIS